MTRPAGNDASMKVKITGIQVKIIAWVGSGGVGFMRICRNMVTPMISGQTPIISICGTRERQQAEQVEERGRIGRGQILDPAEERRVPHLDGDVEHLVEREEHRDLQQHRPAAGDRIDLLGLVELHHRLLLLHLVVRVFLADLQHLRLHLLHVRHRLVGLVGEREEDGLDDDGGGEDGEAEIAEQLVEPVDQPEHRLGDEIEPAPVDQQVELADVAGPSRRR